MAGVVNSVFARLDTYRRFLLDRWNLTLRATRTKAKEGREWVLRRFTAVRTQLRVVLLTWWYAHRRRAFWACCIVVSLAAAVLVTWQWSELDSYLSSLEKPVISELAIGVGAAITGIIAIAFSLSLFAIQQVADRGTPATVQAYARDPVLNVIYWILAVLATSCFAAALLKVATTYRTVTVVVGLLALILSFILLNIHFKRVVKFADPRYTVSRFYKQGEGQLKRLKMLRDSIVPKESRSSRG